MELGICDILFGQYHLAGFLVSQSVKVLVDLNAILARDMCLIRTFESGC
jgi:hypothetical protein